MYTFFQLQGIVAGWGLTTQDGTVSSVLREVAVPIITNAQCRATSYKSMIVSTMLCAGYVNNGGKDACQVRKNISVWYSFNIFCCFEVHFI